MWLVGFSPITLWNKSSRGDIMIPFTKVQYIHSKICQRTGKFFIFSSLFRTFMPRCILFWPDLNNVASREIEIFQYHTGLGKHDILLPIPKPRLSFTVPVFFYSEVCEITQAWNWFIHSATCVRVWRRKHFIVTGNSNLLCILNAWPTIKHKTTWKKISFYVILCEHNTCHYKEKRDFTYYAVDLCSMDEVGR